MAPKIGLALISVVLAQQVIAAPQDYAIYTFKNEQLLGTRKVKLSEMRDGAIALTSTFKDKSPSYQVLLDVAKGMTAKDRCFNLFVSRVAIASIEAGKLDASQYAEEFFGNSIESIEAVNTATQVRCEMK